MPNNTPDSIDEIISLIKTVINSIISEPTQKINEIEIIDKIQNIITSATINSVGLDKFDQKISVQLNGVTLALTPVDWMTRLDFNLVAEKLLQVKNLEKVKSNPVPFLEDSDEGDDEWEVQDALKLQQDTPLTNWDIDKNGVNTEIYTIFLSQFGKRNESIFALNNVYSVNLPELQEAEERVGASNVPFIFRTNDEERNVIYFLPAPVYFKMTEKEETFHADTTEARNKPIEDDLKLIKKICKNKNLNKKTRFIIPLFEMPDSKSMGHAILFCMDYDPVKNSLEPVIFDSISRRLLNIAIKYAKNIQHTTCNTVLQSAISQVFFEKNLEVKPLKRYDYGHQNRISEGNCGAYTFRISQMAVDQYVEYDTLEELYAHIPRANGWVKADNFLTSAHIKELTSSVQESKRSGSTGEILEINLNLNRLRDLKKISPVQSVGDDVLTTPRNIFTFTQNIEERVNGKTQIYLAVEKGLSDLVSQLYQKGVNIDTCGPDNDSAFVAAARLGHSDIVKSMLEIRQSRNFSSGMERRKQDKEGKTALHYLAENADLKNIQLFLQSVNLLKEKYSDFADILDNNNESALHIMARNGNVDLFNMINTAFKGSTSYTSYYIKDIFPQSLTKKNNEGLIPIEIAAHEGHRDVVELLAKSMGLNKEDKKKYIDSIGKNNKPASSRPK